ncbi:MAG TPA: ATP-grasp domain-containing protein [Candidatus Saccharimonas sp.]|nr:ATP-grasp domain-containing protein [Candidatus Saccharimonas sp.]
MSWLEDTITYDKRVPLGAIYDDKSVFVHLHRLFENFITVGAGFHESWLGQFGLTEKDFTLPVDRSRFAKSWKLASSKQFADFVKGSPRRKFLLYGPLDPPYRINPLSYIMNSPTIAHAYEHKRYFRDEFSDLINMPEYVVLKLDDLTGHMYAELRARFDGKFVVQEVESSGSKGTFIISKRVDYDRAVASLRNTSYSATVVVSRFVKGLPCSVQVCITKYGIFTGGLQNQLVSSKYLCKQPKADAPAGEALTEQWCGGELGGPVSEIVKHRIQEIATVVGSELASHGYRGIFGIDLLVTPESEVYAIEVNARLTGYTHILSDIQYAKQKIPFILLHTLELGNYKYEVNDLDALANMTSLDEKFSYVIIHNISNELFKIPTNIKVGLYRIDGDQLTFVKQSYTVEDIKDDKSVLIFCKWPKGHKVPSGKRIIKFVKRGKCMAANGELDVKTQRQVQIIKNAFNLPDVKVD